MLGGNVVVVFVSTIDVSLMARASCPAAFISRVEYSTVVTDYMVSMLLSLSTSRRRGREKRC